VCSRALAGPASNVKSACIGEKLPRFREEMGVWVSSGMTRRMWPR